MQRHGDPSYTQCGTSPIAPPNVGLYTGVGTGSAPRNVGWNTGVTTLTQCGAAPMVAVCTHEHAVDGCGDLTGRQCLFRGGHGRCGAAAAGVAVASTARPNTAARIFLMVPSRELVGGHHGRCVRPSPCTDRDDAMNVTRCDTVAQCRRS